MHLHGIMIPGPVFPPLSFISTHLLLLFLPFYSGKAQSKTEDRRPDRVCRRGGVKVRGYEGAWGGEVGSDEGGGC